MQERDDMVTTKSIVLLVLGILAGNFLAVLAFLYNDAVQHYNIRHNHVNVFLPTSVIARDENLKINKKENFINDRNIADTNSTAVELYTKVRVLCWVMTSPTTLYTKAIHIRSTWGKRCNKLIFVSSLEDNDFPAVGLNVEEGRQNLYEKTRKAFQYIWDRHKNDADWFMKTDDDTFVILENLRYLLKDYDHNQPLYFGRRFKPYVQQGYMSGGAGYVLSRAALNRYQRATRKQRCPRGMLAEDIEIGKCLSYIGVKAMDSRDHRKRETFFPFAPEYHLRSGRIPKSNWYWKHIFYPDSSGPDCCSNYPISFHYVTPDMMYVYEYFVYRLHVFGVNGQRKFDDVSEQRQTSNISAATTHRAGMIELNFKTGRKNETTFNHMLS